jgi:hypothetical protein
MTSNGGGRSPSPSPSRDNQLDTAPVDWGAVTQSLIDAAIARERRFNEEALAEERRFNHEVMAAVIAEMRAAANDDLEHAVRLLTVELADLKATLAEMRLVFATDRTQALELPNPLPKRADLN